MNDGASLDGLQAAGLRILSSADTCARVLGVRIRITCGTEGHGPSDPHSRGVGLDFGTRDLTTDQILDFVQAMQTLLPRDEFTVLLETPAPFHDGRLASVQYVNPHATAPHLHVQLRKFLTVWPLGPTSETSPA